MPKLTRTGALELGPLHRAFDAYAGTDRPIMAVIQADLDKKGYVTTFNPGFTAEKELYVGFLEECVRIFQGALDQALGGQN